MPVRLAELERACQACSPRGRWNALSSTRWLHMRPCRLIFAPSATFFASSSEKPIHLTLLSWQDALFCREICPSFSSLRRSLPSFFAEPQPAASAVLVHDLFF